MGYIWTLVFSILEYFVFHLCATWPLCSVFIRQRGLGRLPYWSTPGWPSCVSFSNRLPDLWGFFPLRKNPPCSTYFITYCHYKAFASIFNIITFKEIQNKAVSKIGLSSQLMLTVVIIFVCMSFHLWVRLQ